MTTVEQPRMQFVRPDGQEKVTGTGRYTADLTFTGEAHAAFRYADHPHARIVRVDATAARALPGVLAVLTHEEVPDVLYGGMVQDRRLFARDAVRFEGDIVAGVAALTPENARPAAALVDVEGSRPRRDRLRHRARRRRCARPSRLESWGRRGMGGTGTRWASRRSSRATPGPGGRNRSRGPRPTPCREFP
jgi:xanthine dehydrogenase molybdopterin-binding subunit B